MLTEASQKNKTALTKEHTDHAGCSNVFYAQVRFPQKITLRHLRELNRIPPGPRQPQRDRQIRVSRARQVGTMIDYRPLGQLSHLQESTASSPC